MSNVTNALHAKDLIAPETKEYVVTTVGVPASAKANTLMLDVANRLDASLDEKEYLVKVCNVLTQQGGAIKEIGNVMLKELGMHIIPLIIPYINAHLFSSCCYKCCR